MEKEKNNSNLILVVIGIILILVQIINYCGVSRMYTGLFPDNEHLLYPNYSIDESGLNVKKVFFAFEAGLDRFASGFEDLTFPEDEWRTISSTQYTSAFVRESLGCSDGGSFGLIVYDFFVLISYCSVGIIGVVLLILARKVGKTPPDNQHTSSIQNNIEESAKKEYKCDMCEHSFEKVTYAKITDDMGVMYRNLCDACIEIYNATPEENK